MAAADHKTPERAGLSDPPQLSKLLSGVPHHPGPLYEAAFWQQFAAYARLDSTNVSAENKKQAILVSHVLEVARHVCSRMQHRIKAIEGTAMAHIPDTHNLAQEHHNEAHTRINDKAVDREMYATPLLTPLPEDKHFEVFATNKKVIPDEHHLAAQYLNCEEEYLLQLCDAGRRRIRYFMSHQLLLQHKILVNRTVPKHEEVTRAASNTAEAYSHWIRHEFRREAQKHGWQGHLYLHIQATGLLQAASSSVSESLLHCLFLASKEVRDDCVKLLWELDCLNDCLVWTLASKTQGLSLRPGSLSVLRQTLFAYWMIQRLPINMVKEILSEVKKHPFTVFVAIPTQFHNLRKLFTDQQELGHEEDALVAKEQVVGAKEKQVALKLNQTKEDARITQTKVAIESGRVEEERQALAALLLDVARAQMMAQGSQEPVLKLPLAAQPHNPGMSPLQSQLDAIAEEFQKKAGGLGGGALQTGQTHGFGHLLDK